MWGSHCGEDADVVLLACDTVQNRRYSPTFLTELKFTSLEDIMFPPNDDVYLRFKMVSRPGQQPSQRNPCYFRELNYGRPARAQSLCWLRCHGGGDYQRSRGTCRLHLQTEGEVEVEYSSEIFIMICKCNTASQHTQPYLAIRTQDLFIYL
jgi:hypothetical protein